MKILLTGEPGIGKSTIVERFTQLYDLPKVGVIGKEMRDSSGERVGFEAITFEGKKRVFAHTSLIESPYIIGNIYHVDLAAIEEFVIPEIEKGLQTKALIILDEIGRMQALSTNFLRTVECSLAADGNLLATIVYDPEPWSISFKQHPEVFLIEVNEENRTGLPNILLAMFQHEREYSLLNGQQQAEVKRLFSEYLSVGKTRQIGKLWNNALSYVVGKKVVQAKEADTFDVKGNTRSHHLRLVNGAWQCDCDLFRGLGEYLHEPGICSHIQAVELFKLSQKSSMLACCA